MTSSRRQGGRSELQDSKLKSGRHELVIRPGNSTAQKFWKIDSTHSYVPDRDQSSAEAHPPSHSNAA